MPLPQIAIPNFLGASTNVNTPNSGRQNAVDSAGVVLSAEDLAALTALHNDLVAIEAFVDGLETLQTAANASLATLVAAAGSAVDSGVEPHQPIKQTIFTPTLDTNIYAVGDVLFQAQAIAVPVSRANDMHAMLQSLVLIDKAKQAPGITLLFYSAAVTSAALNAANNLSDADQLKLLGYVDILAADWKTFANNSVVTYAGAKAPGLILEPGAGTQTIWIAGIVLSGTPTYALGDLQINLGVIQQ